MNGLTLRINKGVKKKNSLNHSPVNVSEYLKENSVNHNPLCEEFLDSKSRDEQLMVLKNILDGVKETQDDITIKFLVTVFLDTEAKHPVKLFLQRHITKNPTLQQMFADALSIKIKALVTSPHTSLEQHTDVVSKLAACMENFPAGSTALKTQEGLIVAYLDSCLQICIVNLQNSQPLSPTEKNQIYNLVHTDLRLLLQFFSHQNGDVESLLLPTINSVMKSIQVLLFEVDVPMDTKSVSGILYLTLFCLKNGPDAWIEILSSKSNNETVNLLLSTEASRLALYSAIVTVIPGDKVHNQEIDGEPALLLLNKKVLEIVERASSDSTLTLAVARTLHQISRSLCRITDSSLGRPLVSSLLVFVWAHLGHYMDSVRHLAAFVLNDIVKYCSKLDREGDPESLSNLFNLLSDQNQHLRKSYYVALSCLTTEVGAERVMGRIPNLVPSVIEALSTQAVQAAATTTLEAILDSLVKQTESSKVCSLWVEPLLRRVTNQQKQLDSSVLNILEKLLVIAAKREAKIVDYILGRIKTSGDDLPYTLMMVSVIRRCGGESSEGDKDPSMWRGIITYSQLDEAAVCATDETRILALSLIVESPRTTETFTAGELQFVRKFLQYNINAQSPNFRQLMLSLLKKFIKRLDDSWKVLERQKDSCEHYEKFVELLRMQCVDSLVPGANYTRRMVALQVLAWMVNCLFGCMGMWSENDVSRLLVHLEDSYENNKILALEILLTCPVHLIKSNYSSNLDIEDVMKLASSTKPTDCVTAAYKLDLIRQKLPEIILEGVDNDNCPAERVMYELIRKLHVQLCMELSVCERSIVMAAATAPMYGLLHCILHLVTKLDVDAISHDEDWRTLVSELIVSCARVSSSVASVVNNSSPEGHLPMDRGGVADHGNLSGVRLKDGRQVTAQMVLLCAWRSVKEVSLLLGEVSSRLSVSGEGGAEGTLSHTQLLTIGQHFTALLTETKHRGAFEQAYVGFCKLLARLWRCRSANLHELPRTWLSELLAVVAGEKSDERGDERSDKRRGALCATRRSAGLPFMIQALVTTELQVQGNPKCFHHCMATLLRLARTPPRSEQQTETAIETRTHSINILRALFRNSSLDESVASYVGEGLIVALEGFEGRTWMERNSSTLLLSALVVRVFGVPRQRHGHNHGHGHTVTDGHSHGHKHDNKMTGRIFFLRYPQLYDFMLKKLEEATSDVNSQLLRPALYPILLLLGRLYPSALEGTVSNLKVVSFIPLVLRCARSPALLCRQLAARAMQPLISPQQYVQHIQQMFDLICDDRIKRNYCHGILLQLIRLLSFKPHDLVLKPEECQELSLSVKRSLWILEQTYSETPCWLLVDEYVKMINLMIMSFSSVILLQEDILLMVAQRIHSLLLDQDRVYKINSGKDISLANALYLFFIIVEIKWKEQLVQAIYIGLEHSAYEVVLSALNFILILKADLNPENKFEEHLARIANKEIVLFSTPYYLQILSVLLKENKYLECTQKTLRVLMSSVSAKEAATLIVETKVNTEIINDQIILKTLINCIENDHESLTHLYLEALSKYVTEKLRDKEMKLDALLEVIRVFFACSSFVNNDSTRSVVADFLCDIANHVFKLDLKELSEEKQFEYKATIYAMFAMTIEDDDEEIRLKAARAISLIHSAALEDNSSTQVPVALLASEWLREIIYIQEKSDLFNCDRVLAFYVVLALLDFKSEVCLNDEANNECRVFDQNERHNIFLEETIWTKECAERINSYSNNSNNLEIVLSILHNPIYKDTVKKLCGNNAVVFEKIAKGNGDFTEGNVINPKIEMFVQSLQR